MQSFGRFFLPLVLCLITASCTSPAETNSANNSNTNQAATISNKANPKPEELGMLINFTLEPEDIVWQQTESPKRVVAVFRLDVEDTKKFADQLSSKSQGAARAVPVEDWFPPELRAGAETTGSSTVDGTAFPADEFYQAPYTQGTITRIDNTDFFVLELSAP